MATNIIDIHRADRQRKARAVNARVDRDAKRVALGKRLAALRKAAGLTQAQVARSCSVTQGRLSALESGNGDLSFEQRAQLARVYRLTVESLTEDPLDVVLGFINARPGAKLTPPADLTEFRERAGR